MPQIAPIGPMSTAPTNAHTLSLARKNELATNARLIVADGKGILAADESSGTAGKRLASIGLENTVNNRQQYRQVLFSAADKLKNFLGGVILFEETVDQKTVDGSKLLTDYLREAGILCGIKLDKGTVILPGTNDETVTQGIDGLAERCSEFYGKGCRFAKWRCVLKITSDGLCPSQLAIDENANVLARYAAICQINGLVPIVEPEILLDGDYDLESSAQVSQRVISTLYKRMHDHHVFLEGSLLKPSMVLPGQSCPQTYTPQQIAQATMAVLLRSVPAAVPGITFLSGGQSEEQASINLNAINALPQPKPWRVTFSFARALQHSCLQTWAGKSEMIEAAQEMLVKRAQTNSLASKGQYVCAKGISSAHHESLFVQDYRY